MLKQTAFLSGLFLSVFVSQVSAQTTYTIPDELTPVSKWAQGFTAEEAEKFRKAYQAPDYPSGNDRTVFAYLNLSEILPTMIISRGGQASSFETSPIPEIADVVATTLL